MTGCGILITQPFTALVEEFVEVIAFVIRIRPATALPAKSLIEQRHFSENSAAQVDAMIAILRRRQDKFGFRQIAWIKVNRPRFFPFLESLEFCLLYTSPSPRDATLSRMPSSA